MNIEKLADNFNKEVAEFFETKPINIKVRILANRKVYNATIGHETKNWSIGFARGNTIYMLDKKRWEIESIHQKSEFGKALKHEIAHVYYRNIKDNSLPSWLNEGVAMYVANQTPLGIPDKVGIVNLDDFHTKAASHNIGIFMVSKIMEEYGKEKLFELIKMDDKQKRYKELKKMFEWLK